MSLVTCPLVLGNVNTRVILVSCQHKMVSKLKIHKLNQVKRKCIQHSTRVSLISYPLVLRNVNTRERVWFLVNITQYGYKLKIHKLNKVKKMQQSITQELSLVSRLLIVVYLNTRVSLLICCQHNTI